MLIFVTTDLVLKKMHYRLRAIRGGPFGVVNFASHCQISNRISRDEINSSRSQLKQEGGGVELFCDFQIFDTRTIAQILPEKYLLFYSTGSLYSPCKISSSAKPPFYLFGILIFTMQNLGHTSTDCAVFLVVLWGLKGARNKRLL